MKHRIKHRKFSRTSSHKMSMLNNMACSLILSEKISTTLPKAKELRPYLERIVTKARLNTLHVRRQLIARLKSEGAVQKLMKDVAPRFVERNGGYLRIIKTGFRLGDCAPTAIIEFVA